MSGPQLTRRIMFAATPSLLALASLPAIPAAAEPTPAQNFRRFLEWADLGPAMDFAEAAGFQPAHIYCVVMKMPNGPQVSSVLFSKPDGELATFTNKGRS